MKTTRRKFLQTSTAAASAAGFMPSRAREATKSAALQPNQIAKGHSIIRVLPGPDFFEGMLLGNGDIGVCVVVRPDALGLHLGKNDSWDIRVDEESAQHVLSFPELLKLWERASQEAKRLDKPDMLYLETSIPFFREYTERVRESYGRIWPRPWPCGVVWIHWDPRWVHAGRQVLDPSCGFFTLELNICEVNRNPHTATVSSFVDWKTGLVSVSTDAAAPFVSVDYYPELDRPRLSPFGSPTAENAVSPLPPPEIDGQSAQGYAEFSCLQNFPAAAPISGDAHPTTSSRDRNFALAARLKGTWRLEGLGESQERLRQHGSTPRTTYFHYPRPPGVYLKGGAEQPFRLDLTIVTPRDILLEKLERKAAASGEENPWIVIPQDREYAAECAETLSHAKEMVAQGASRPIAEIRSASERNWKRFWSRSAVGFEDKELEKIWYHNQYFLACSLRERKTAPGLFGNWMSGPIGTAWHSDYHLDYNEQQIYWGVFSSNHVEQHLPYVEICQNLLGMCEAFAREKMGYPGAFFPVSAYPAPSQVIPYPAPPWGYQICMTPWTVQSLWWQYVYTQDIEYLRRVYPILRSPARFLAAYVKKGGDGKYHIVPTVSCENWGFTVDYRLNKDCILDLALTEFLLDAVIEASKLLGVDANERIQWKEIRENLGPYPKITQPQGEVWVDVVNAPPECVYNVPLTLGPVFPAEQVGLGRHEEQLSIARRTARLVRLEGGNDLVFQPLIRARLGMLDLKWFKNQVRYCLLLNGAAGDRVRQVGGRYTDSTPFDFMMRMGVWTENLALPAVLNECLLQSYTGVLRLFPNTQNLGPASFENLRAVGAFLVSASYDGHSVSGVSLLSERGKTARLLNPWGPQPAGVTRSTDRHRIPVRWENDILVFNTQAGERYRIEPT
jgi:alpha-L-fucosidase 2